MARFPCAVNGHRYLEPQSAAYCAGLNGMLNARSKLRLCPTHVQELGSWLEDNLLKIPDGDLPSQWGQEQLDNCFECKAPQVPWSLFADVYRRGTEPARFAGASCDAHFERFKERVSLSL